MTRFPLILTIFFLGGCTGSEWGWYVISPGTQSGRINLGFLLSGLGYTISVSILAMIFSIAIGLLFALLGISSNRAARWSNRAYVEFFRAIPMLVMVLWVYYGLPVVLGISIDTFWAGVLALALSDSAFEAEIFRGGIQSISRGQVEAADSIGLSYIDKMRYIILPQAIRRILPPLGNQFVYMLKMSSLVSVIGLAELTRRANELVVSEYRPLEIYSFLVLEYLVLIVIVSYFVRRMEKKMRADEHQH
ncbi:MAG: amino acid ABC transporter permease [SAR324 cluster bacterium]|nr:amino acid ABC transporter permease [SAR324 cluster bacterium]